MHAHYAGCTHSITANPSFPHVQSTHKHANAFLMSPCGIWKDWKAVEMQGNACTRGKMRAFTHYKSFTSTRAKLVHSCTCFNNVTMWYMEGPESSRNAGKCMYTGQDERAFTCYKSFTSTRAKLVHSCTCFHSVSMRHMEGQESSRDAGKCVHTLQAARIHQLHFTFTRTEHTLTCTCILDVFMRHVEGSRSAGKCMHCAGRRGHSPQSMLLAEM